MGSVPCGRNVSRSGPISLYFAFIPTLDFFPGRRIGTTGRTAARFPVRKLGARITHRSSATQ